MTNIETQMAQVINSYRTDGKSWTWLSRKFGLPESTLQSIATQKHSPSLHTVELFWSALGMTVTLIPKED